MEGKIINPTKKEHILVCLSSAPSNTKIIQTAAAMARAFHASFSALYVKTPASEYMGTEDKNRLLASIHFAEKCGASGFRGENFAEIKGGRLPSMRGFRVSRK